MRIAVEGRRLGGGVRLGSNPHAGPAACPGGPMRGSGRRWIALGVGIGCSHVVDDFSGSALCGASCLHSFQYLIETQDRVSESKAADMATSSSVTAPLLRLIDSPGSVIIKQGAEAKVYRSQLFREPPQLFLPAQDPSQQASTSSASTLPAPPVLIKYRFPKHYRHKSLSESITAQRTISEARALVRCARNGVSVPGVVAVDDKSGVLALEWIDGKSVRELLGGGAEDDEVEDSLDGAEADEAEEEEIVLEDEDVKSKCTFSSKGGRIILIFLLLLLKHTLQSP